MSDHSHGNHEHTSSRNRRGGGGGRGGGRGRGHGGRGRGTPKHHQGRGGGSSHHGSPAHHNFTPAQELERLRRKFPADEFTLKLCGKTPPFRCDICFNRDVFFIDNESDVRKHVETNKHRDMLLEKPDKADDSDSEYPGISLNHVIARFKCTLCDIKLENFHAAHSHLRGRLHTNKIEAEKAKNLEPLQEVTPGSPEQADLLSRALLAYFEAHAMESEQERQRDSFRTKLEEKIKTRIDPEASLHFFGSSMNGFGSKKSDLDMCLVVPSVAESDDEEADDDDVDAASLASDSDDELTKHNGSSFDMGDLSAALNGASTSDMHPNAAQSHHQPPAHQHQGPGPSLDRLGSSEVNSMLADLASSFED